MIATNLEKNIDLLLCFVEKRSNYCTSVLQYHVAIRQFGIQKNIILHLEVQHFLYGMISL